MGVGAKRSVKPNKPFWGVFEVAGMERGMSTMRNGRLEAATDKTGSGRGGGGGPGGRGGAGGGGGGGGAPGGGGGEGGGGGGMRVRARCMRCDVHVLWFTVD